MLKQTIDWQIHKILVLPNLQKMKEMQIILNLFQVVAFFIHTLKDDSLVYYSAK